LEGGKEKGGGEKEKKGGGDAIFSLFYQLMRERAGEKKRTGGGGGGKVKVLSPKGRESFARGEKGGGGELSGSAVLDLFWKGKGEEGRSAPSLLQRTKRGGPKRREKRGKALL